MQPGRELSSLPSACIARDLKKLQGSEACDWTRGRGDTGTRHRVGALGPGLTATLWPRAPPTRQPWLK